MEILRHIFGIKGGIDWRSSLSKISIGLIELQLKVVEDSFDEWENEKWWRQICKGKYIMEDLVRKWIGKIKRYCHKSKMKTEPKLQEVQGNISK